MSANITELPISSVAPVSTATNGNYLFGRTWDFLLLGGGSLIALGLIRFAIGLDWGQSYFLTFLFANIINHPHFAHSYQIFYRDFRKKLTEYPTELRVRYFVSGVAVPTALIAFFALTILYEAPRALGIGANLMFFLVGWHYVKQGYGMAMVDAVLKRAFYSDREKKAILYNAYTTWIFSWLLVNYLVSSVKSIYFGIEYFVIPVPLMLLTAAGAFCLITMYGALRSLLNRIAEGKPIAWNGIISYAVSLYAWLLFRDPIVLLWIPLFHSLQYLAVVWRFETNRSRATVSSIRPALRFGLFVAAGMGMGYLGFWLVPQFLDANVSYSKELFGGTLFIFMFWIFINVHHYFLDSVMWRKGNPDVQKHLFSHQVKA